QGARLRFRFRGKSKKVHVIEVTDRRIARIVAKCTDLPGQELFQYVDESGELHSVESSDVNDCIRAIAGREFTAKDFRPSAGTLWAARTFCQMAAAAPTPTKKAIVDVVKVVSQQLGNTPSVCRKCYVHPAIFEMYERGRLVRALGD